MDEEKQQVEKELADSIANSGVGFFIPEFQKLVESTGALRNSTDQMVEVVKQFFEIPAIITPANKPPTTATSGADLDIKSDVTAGNTFDLAKLALILPLLMNKESREYLANFAAGLIGTENVDLVNTSIKGLAVVLAGVFSVKLFKQVYNTFNTVRKLSQLTSILFGLSQEATSASAADLEEQKQKNERSKNRRKRQRKGKITRLKKLKKLKSLLKFAKFGGPVGLIIGGVIGAGVGTLLDTVEKAEENQNDAEDEADEKDVDAPVEAKPVQLKEVVSMFVDNLLSEFSFGLFGMKSKKEEDTSEPSGNMGMEVTDLELGGVDSSGSTVNTGEPKPEKKAPITPTGNQSAGNLENTSLEMAGVDDTSSPPSEVQPEPSTPTTGAVINTASESNKSERRQSETSTTNVLNIDNTTVIRKIGSDNTPSDNAGVQTYSKTVGK